MSAMQLCVTLSKSKGEVLPWPWLSSKSWTAKVENEATSELKGCEQSSWCQGTLSGLVCVPRQRLQTITYIGPCWLPLSSGISESTPQMVNEMYQLLPTCIGGVFQDATSFNDDTSSWNHSPKSSTLALSRIALHQMKPSSSKVCNEI